MRIPASTYRIQFNAAFHFDSAKAVIAYLKELGVSDLYASPIFKAREGSTHGYDVVDPNQINPELGSSEAFAGLIQEIQKYNLGWLQDIVPNHMAFDSQNQMLMDVLEQGAASEYIDYFDIAWNQPFEEIKGRILAPILGNYYAQCLENGDLQLSYDQTGLKVNYHSLTLPIRIESYLSFLTENLDKLEQTLGYQHPDYIKFLGLLYILKNIPPQTQPQDRRNQVLFAKRLFWELYEQIPEVQSFVQANLKVFNGEVDKPESFNLLEKLLAEQYYRLAFWKVSAEEINYRRFFTVNELISVKVELEPICQATHELIIDLVKSGTFTGLRIDHIDGLANPTQYLEWLREKTGETYITVEKILEPEEELPQAWPIQGTSGYDFLNQVNGVFCQSENEGKLSEVYQKFTQLHESYETLSLEKKRLIIETNMAGDVDNLAHLLKRIASQSRQGNDFTLNGLKKALIEVLSRFPVYRTYITAQEVSDPDKTYVKDVIAASKVGNPLVVRELEFIENLLLLDFLPYLTEEQTQQRFYFVTRLQQLTGPLMAKGIEDTLLYVYNRFVALNEVGGNPSHFGVSAQEFHQINQHQSQRWLHKMNTTSTHDTKRGEDVRSRLNVLSEIPDEWEQQAQAWQQMNRDKKAEVNGKLIPDSNDEYFLYQTLVGACPFDTGGLPDSLEEFANRVKEYIIKAVREAKVHTEWLRPDGEYEENYLAFVEAILDPGYEFLKTFGPFKQKIAYYGIFNSLSQVLLKVASPGVPDFYQGTELWDLSLVDPDNRRPVDFQQRRGFLEEIQQRAKTDILSLVEELLDCKEDGRIKLFLIAQCLKARREYLSIFQEGDYQPLEVRGKFNDCAIAFARQSDQGTAIAIAPRFFTHLIQPAESPLGELWQDTAIQLPENLAGTWTNAITHQSLPATTTLSLSQALQHFPVALLVQPHS
ncbi:MAG: malto-oligosyltrehalose synthase [Desertifilum sp.]|nr:malto-oligosyltrehalose synthase [Desertifilum sp.]